MKANNKKTAADKAKKASRITLANHQDLTTISNLHGRLKKCASRQVDVNMIAENVESIDASTLQLLLTFVRQIRANGNSVNWQSPSQLLLGSASQLGLEDELFLPQPAE